MVREHGKVPGLVLTATLVGLAACGEARSEDPPATRAAAAAQARAGGAAELAPLPGSREDAARRVREPAPVAHTEAPDAAPEPAPRLESRAGAEATPPAAPAEVSAARGVPAGPEPRELAQPGLVPEPVTPAPDELPDAALTDRLPDPAADGERPSAAPAEDLAPEPEDAAPEAYAPEPPPLRLPAGAEISFTLESEISTRSSRAGDPFFAYVPDDVLTPEGMVLIPLGARIRGRIVDVRVSDGPDEPALIELAVEALIDDGRAYPMVAHVVRTEMDAGTGESTERSVAKVGVGAAAGAILGRILGESTESAVAGALAGAAAGTAAALAAKDGHAVLPAGSTVVVELDMPLDLSTW